MYVYILIGHGCTEEATCALHMHVHTCMHYLLCILCLLHVHVHDVSIQNVPVKTVELRFRRVRYLLHPEDLFPHTRGGYTQYTVCYILTDVYKQVCTCM